MKRLRQLGPVQNMGWIDRTVRTLIGLAMVVVVLMEIQKSGNLGAYAYLPILAIYPLMTAILGWDPLYAAGDVKSCDGSMRNQCGTFPFEMESAAGKHPECDRGFDCSIPGDHHAHHH